MSFLLQCWQSYHSGQIDKATYIRAMYKKHSQLFAYHELLSKANISELQIREDSLVAEFKDPRILMVCPPGDMRIPPLECLNFGDYERSELQTIRKILTFINGSSFRFLDIGANVGFYSLALQYYFPGIQGLAFEPIPATFSILQKNLKLNDAQGVIPINCGLSNKESELIFYTYPSQSAAASMTKNLKISNVVEVRCQVTTLDSYLSKYNEKISFIKCDVEGAELQVFQGAQKILIRDTPVVFTEMLRKWCAKYNYHPNDIIGLFAQLGYQCYAIRDSRIAACAYISDQTVETNFLFLHQVSHATLLAELV